MEKLIGKRIQKYRKEKGLTQEKLSEMIDLSSHHLSALERGVYNIKLSNLVKMLNILECSADDIFCDVVIKSSTVKASELSEKLKGLSIEEQNKIFDVIETMIKNASK